MPDPKHAWPQKKSKRWANPESSSRFRGVLAVSHIPYGGGVMNEFKGHKAPPSEGGNLAVQKSGIETRSLNFFSLPTKTSHQAIPLEIFLLFWSHLSQIKLAQHSLFEQQEAPSGFPLNNLPLLVSPTSPRRSLLSRLPASTFLSRPKSFFFDFPPG